MRIIFVEIVIFYVHTEDKLIDCHFVLNYDDDIKIELIECDLGKC